MRVHPVVQQIRASESVKRTGRIVQIMPNRLLADGPNVPLGTICAVRGFDAGGGEALLNAEVVRVDNLGVYLTPFADVTQIRIGDRVEALSKAALLPVGEGFLGRAVDALGQPIDGLGSVTPELWFPLHTPSPEPLQRVTPKQVLETGIRTIDGLMTLGVGQRVGIFAASGVGKTSLLSQIIRQVHADVVITCLVGERGREVEALWNSDFDGATRKRSILVAATSDQSASLRVRAVYQAVALADFWRQKGQHVLLVLDSMTRFAMALREIGLAAGEPPTVRAYTPSVFSVIPRIVEQGGALRSGGAISAIYTVLSENDEVEDPLSEMLKSLFDGHIILSRDLAERGHFPAIDPLRSVSRNFRNLLNEKHLKHAIRAHGLIARYEETRPLVEAGLYKPGGNAETDEAIEFFPQLQQFMHQDMQEVSPLGKTLEALVKMLQ